MNEELIKQAFSLIERVANDSRTELKIRLDAQVLLKKIKALNTQGIDIEENTIA